jgi:hypothetical protein
MLESFWAADGVTAKADKERATRDERKTKDLTDDIDDIVFFWFIAGEWGKAWGFGDTAEFLAVRRFMSRREAKARIMSQDGPIKSDVE